MFQPYGEPNLDFLIPHNCLLTKECFPELQNSCMNVCFQKERNEAKYFEQRQSCFAFSHSSLTWHLLILYLLWVKFKPEMKTETEEIGNDQIL